MLHWMVKRTERLIPCFIDGECSYIWFYLNWLVLRPLPGLTRIMRLRVLSARYKQRALHPETKARIGRHAAAAPDAGVRKIVVYTALMGRYDKLRLPAYIDPNIDYVCFSDEKLDGQGLWQIKTPPYVNGDKTRMARYVKTHPMELFPNRRIAIWVDASILIRGDITKHALSVIDQGADIGFIHHPFRDCTYDEAKVCRFYGKDGNNIMEKQIEYYRLLQFPEKFGLFETNVFAAALDSEKAREFFDIWWDQINTYSRRDQLSVGYAVWKSGVSTMSLMNKGFSTRNHPDFVLFDHKK